MHQYGVSADCNDLRGFEQRVKSQEELMSVQPYWNPLVLNL